MPQVNTIIFDTDQLMDHGLIGPLIEKRCNRVFFAITDQKLSRGRVARHANNEVTLRSDFFLKPFGYIATKWAAALVPDDWIGTRGHKDSEKTIDNTTSIGLVIKRPHVRLVQRQGQSRANVQAEQVLVDGFEVSEDFLHLIHDVVHIALSELLNLIIGKRVRKIYKKEVKIILDELLT